MAGPRGGKDGVEIVLQNLWLSKHPAQPIKDPAEEDFSFSCKRIRRWRRVEKGETRRMWSGCAACDKREEGAKVTSWPPPGDKRSHFSALLAKRP